MLVTTEGLVLKSIKYGDNSIISTVYTLEEGLISTISARKMGNKNKSSIFLQAFSLIQLVFYSKRNQSLNRTKELSFLAEDGNAYDDVSKNAIRFFIAEFLCHVIKEKEKNPFLYTYLKESSLQLNSSEKFDPCFHLNFLMGLSKLIGIQPNTESTGIYFNLNEGEFCNTKPINTFLENSSCISLRKFFDEEETLSKIERKQVLNALLDYYRVQLDNDLPLKSKDVLEVVFS